MWRLSIFFLLMTAFSQANASLKSELNAAKAQKETELKLTKETQDVFLDIEKAKKALWENGDVYFLVSAEYKRVLANETYLTNRVRQLLLIEYQNAVYTILWRNVCSEDRPFLWKGKLVRPKSCANNTHSGTWSVPHFMANIDEAGWANFAFGYTVSDMNKTPTKIPNLREVTTVRNLIEINFESKECFSKNLLEEQTLKELKINESAVKECFVATRSDFTNFDAEYFKFYKGWERLEEKIFHVPFKNGRDALTPNERSASPPQKDVKSQDKVDGLTWSIGISIANLSGSMATTLGIEGIEGVYVVSVGVNSPAGKAGLKEGDVIIELFGNQITNTQQFVDLMQNFQRDGRSSLLLKVLEPGSFPEFRVVQKPGSGD
jgi:hypothetical protein